MAHITFQGSLSYKEKIIDRWALVTINDGCSIKMFSLQSEKLLPPCKDTWPFNLSICYFFTLLLAMSRKLVYHRIFMNWFCDFRRNFNCIYCNSAQLIDRIPQQKTMAKCRTPLYFFYDYWWCVGFWTMIKPSRRSLTTKHYCTTPLVLFPFLEGAHH